MRTLPELLAKQWLEQAISTAELSLQYVYSADETCSKLAHGYTASTTSVPDKSHLRQAEVWLRGTRWYVSVVVSHNRRQLSCDLTSFV